jgi:hypothetical protein
MFLSTTPQVRAVDDIRVNAFSLQHPIPHRLIPLLPYIATAPTILPAAEASEKHGCSGNLWLFGEEHAITEVGSMNIFFVLRKEDGSGTVKRPDGFRFFLWRDESSFLIPPFAFIQESSS